MKVLVLTAEPVSAGQLRDALPGDSDPAELEVMLVAPARDALGTFAADRIVVSSHPPGEQLHGEGVATSELRERLGLPVDRAVIRAGD